MSERYVVIMAGGRGERFWPQSRLKRPKQLLPIVGDKPLLAQTIERLGDLVPREHIFIITNEEQAAAVREICPEVPASQIIGEPVGRDTAAAVGLATLLVRQKSSDATFAMLPADHIIHDSKGFQDVLAAAFEAAEQEDALVTVGIEPEFPATGYGYIHRSDQRFEKRGHPVFGVERFVEKPDLEKATSYVESGEYLWNGGMFIWRVPVVTKAFEQHASELWAQIAKMGDDLASGQALDAVLAAHYPNLKKISIDYALMENASNVLTVPSAFDWDDVGAWPALARHLKPDANGNVGRGDTIVQDGSGNIVISTNGHLTAVLGLQDCIVVHTEDATLVCPRDRAQDIKELVKKIGANPDWKELV